MKITTCRIALAAALALPLAAGCSKETTQAASNTAESGMNDMKQLGSKAGDAMKNVPAELAQLQKSAEQKLAGAGATMKDLEAKAGTKSAEVQKEIEALGKQIGAKKAELEKAMSNVDWKGMSSEAYATAKAKIDALSTELTQLVEKAKAKMM